MSYASKLLEDAGAVMKGHFVLSSGRHSDVYVEKFRALEKPSVAVELGAAIAKSFRDGGIDVVLAPAVGGITLGFATALALDARAIFAEREEGKMALRRGFQIEPTERVLVVEDVVTTGKSVLEILDLVYPGELVGIGCLVDRSGGEASFPVPLASLVRMQPLTWEPDKCPLCARGVPMSMRGSRHLVASPEKPHL